MSDLLFDIPEFKSPRLLWLETHGITTRKYSPDEFDWFAGQDFAWVASSAKEWGQGETEDEAITQLAMRLGIRLWNEIQPAEKPECDRCFGTRVIDRPESPESMLPRYGNCPKCNPDCKGGEK